MDDLHYPLWSVIHGVAIKYERDGKVIDDGVIDFYKSIGHVVGCKTCIRHYYKFIDENPIPRNGGLFTWTVQLHNSVNERLGKPIVSVDEAYNIWFNTNAKSGCRHG